MGKKAHNPTIAERDERVSVPIDPEAFLRGLLAVKTDDDDADTDND